MTRLSSSTLPSLSLVYALSLSGLVVSAPQGFPASGNGLWYSEPGSIWSRHYLPVGNGYLAAMTPGGVGFESTQLNIESLWSGGPFSDPVNQLSRLLSIMVIVLTKEF